jgi:hypothetical protein
MRRVKPAIGEVELDLGRYELRRLGRRVKLEKKPMELLFSWFGRVNSWFHAGDQEALFRISLSILSGTSTIS